MPVQNPTSASSLKFPKPKHDQHEEYTVYKTNPPLTIGNKNGVDTFADKNSPSIT